MGNLTKEAWQGELHKGVVEQNSLMVETAIHNGADPNFRDRDGWTPLMYALVRSPKVPSKCLQSALTKWRDRPRHSCRGRIARSNFVETNTGMR